jgi:hypothetical protein
MLAYFQPAREHDRWRAKELKVLPECSCSERHFLDFELFRFFF